MFKIFWLILLLGAYLWVLTSDHDEFIISKAKALYETVIGWVDNADSDFHLKKEKPKKHRRWD
jgi:hypothetical protein